MAFPSGHRWTGFQQAGEGLRWRWGQLKHQGGVWNGRRWKYNWDGTRGLSMREGNDLCMKEMVFEAIKVGNGRIGVVNRADDSLFSF